MIEILPKELVDRWESNRIRMNKLRHELTEYLNTKGDSMVSVRNRSTTTTILPSNTVYFTTSPSETRPEQPKCIASLQFSSLLHLLHH